MTCNSSTARLVSHCSSTRTARTSRTGGLMTFTTRIKSCILVNPLFSRHVVCSCHLGLYLMNATTTGNQFTVVCLVTLPMNASKAGGDLACFDVLFSMPAS